MSTSEQVRIRKDERAFLDKLSGALKLQFGGKWPTSKVITWLRETHGIKLHEPLPWLCGRCLRPIFWPSKTRLMLGRRGKCPHCGAGYVLRRHIGAPPTTYENATERALKKDIPKGKKSSEIRWRLNPPSLKDYGPFEYVGHRPAVSDQLSLTLQARMKAGEEFELWFIW